MAPELCDHAVAAVLREQDTVHGGFGTAPKFPPSALLEALLRNYERTGSAAVLQAVAHAGTAMARGGIYDQLAGGFARYSVDNAWVVPHFEKMLYDNALLLRVYAHWARRTGDPLARRVTAQTARFLLDDLADGDMFTSSLDADADGREGSTYVWTPAQLTEVLGADDGRWAAEVFGVTAAGTFEHGTSVLQLLSRPRRSATPGDGSGARLLAARLARVQPGRDDKVVTSWNGLAITALAEASVALDDPELAHAAQRCAAALLNLHVVDGRLRRASLGGVVGDSAAILEDYAMLATGLLALYQLSAEQAWLTAATGLLDTAVQHFGDPQRPGRWFDTADDAEQLVRAARRPAGRGHAVGGLVDHRGAAERRSPGRRRPSRAVSAGGRRHPGRALGVAGTRAAFGRALAGGGRSRGARAAADRGRLRRAVVAAAGRRAPAGSRRGDRRRRRGGLVAAAGRPRTGWPGPTPPTCVVVGSATCR